MTIEPALYFYSERPTLKALANTNFEPTSISHQSTTLFLNKFASEVDIIYSCRGSNTGMYTA